jgi:hypothetical protein
MELNDDRSLQFSDKLIVESKSSSGEFEDYTQALSVFKNILR